MGTEKGRVRPFSEAAMTRKILIFIFLFSLAARSEEGDWGFAHNNYVIKKLTAKWSFLHRSQFALRDDMSDLFFGYADAGAGYKFHPDWRIDLVYRRVWIQLGETWRIEDRPLINLTWFGTLGDARLTNRSRLEFREYRWDKKDDLRFRNETRLELPWSFAGLKPYFEEEFFYGWERRAIEMNWLSAGLSFKPKSNVKLKIG